MAFQSSIVFLIPFVFPFFCITLLSTSIDKAPLPVFILHLLSICLSREPQFSFILLISVVATDEALLSKSLGIGSRNRRNHKLFFFLYLGYLI